MIAPSKPPLEILTSNLSLLRAEESSVKAPFVIGTSIVSFKLTLKLLLLKAEGSPAPCKALVLAPLGKAEEEIVTSVVSQLNSAIVCKVLSVAKSPIPLEILTFILLADTQFSTDCVFVLTAFVEVKMSSWREYILVR